MKNLRDNTDGSCNCRPLGEGCFFTDGFGNKCDCKCHMSRLDELGKEWNAYCNGDIVDPTAFFRKYYEAGQESISHENCQKFIKWEYERGRLEEREVIKKVVEGMKHKTCDEYCPTNELLSSLLYTINNEK